MFLGPPARLLPLIVNLKQLINLKLIVNLKAELRFKNKEPSRPKRGWVSQVRCPENGESSDTVRGTRDRGSKEEVTPSTSSEEQRAAAFHPPATPSRTG